MGKDWCRACGVEGYNYFTYYNKSKNIELKLCTVCEKTAELNGYETKKEKK